MRAGGLVGVVSCVGLALVGLTGPPVAGAGARDRQLPGTPSARANDSWSTLRGCLVILGRCVDCASDRIFTSILTAPPDAGDNRPSKKQIERLLWEWSKPDGRRGQCAVWTRREGADEHIGEQSRLADLARDPKLRCGAFARAILDDRWIPQAIIAATGP